MADLAVLEQLKSERAKLDKAIAVLSGLAGKSGSGGGGRRKLYAAACERIAAAQRARWEVQTEKSRRGFHFALHPVINDASRTES